MTTLCQTAELPGLTMEDLEIYVSDHRQLTIKRKQAIENFSGHLPRQAALCFPFGG